MIVETKNIFTLYFRPLRSRAKRIQHTFPWPSRKVPCKMEPKFFTRASAPKTLAAVASPGLSLDESPVRTLKFIQAESWIFLCALSTSSSKQLEGSKLISVLPKLGPCSRWDLAGNLAYQTGACELYVPALCCLARLRHSQAPHSQPGRVNL